MAEHGSAEAALAALPGVAAASGMKEYRPASQAEAAAEFARARKAGAKLLCFGDSLYPAALMDIHDGLAPADQAYFRESREKRFGKRLEEVPSAREAGLDAFRASLAPLRSMLDYQQYIGGTSPLFADYIVFGAFQWARVMSPFVLLANDDPMRDWFERCLDLHDGLGRRVAAA